MSFPFFVASRYLRTKRKERFISVVTIISVIGTAVGVAALVVAMAINNGVQNDLRSHLLGATAHINLLEQESIDGIEDWPYLIEKIATLDHVDATAPVLYGEVFISGPVRGRGCILKGISPREELQVAGLLSELKEGALDELELPDAQPGIILGSDLAEHIGVRLNSQVTVLNPSGEWSPFGRLPGVKRYRVAGIIESGFYEFDARWAFASLRSVQQAFALDDVINAIEVKLDDMELAPQVAVSIQDEVGPSFRATTWMEQNRVLFNALETEKLVTAITISLIMLVAALNILSSLVMNVMEKNKDIAILIAMGAKRKQIRSIFMLQGLAIGILGTILGLILGHAVAYACDAYQLIPLDAQVYGLAYVPFQPQLFDAVWVALAALGISYLTTLYPATSAARIGPVEVLRYE